MLCANVISLIASYGRGDGLKVHKRKDLIESSITAVLSVIEADGLTIMSSPLFGVHKHLY